MDKENLKNKLQAKFLVLDGPDGCGKYAIRREAVKIITSLKYPARVTGKLLRLK